MSLPIHLALVPDGVDIPEQEITKVGAALSKQIERDFAPIWKTDATISAFVRLEDVPVDYWPIIIMRNVKDAAGYHQDENGQPFAVVEFESEWSLTASHEMLEMLADPFGRRLRAANLLDQAIQLEQEPKRVRYLVEVCDPCEAGQFSYQINGIQVSDFYTPNFFDPVKSTVLRYSFTGAIDSPLKVLEGGYISWVDPISGHWFQLRMFPDDFNSQVPHILDLSLNEAFENLRKKISLRSAVDLMTRHPKYQDTLPKAPVLTSRTFVRDNTLNEEQKNRADSIRKEVSELMNNH